MKKILMISFRYPWPFFKGGYILRFINFAKILSKRYKLDLLTLKEGKEKGIKDLKKIFQNVFVFPQPLWRKIISSSLALFSKRPIQLGYFFNKKMASWLLKNEKNYHLLLFFTIRTAQYGTNLKTKKILDFIDALSLNFSKRAEFSNFFKKILFKIEAKRILNYEISLLKRKAFDKFIISSPYDLNFLKERVGEVENFFFVPNSLDEKIFKIKKEKEKKKLICFLGKLDYFPNEDAVLFFAKKIFPSIRKMEKKAEFSVIGINPSKKILSLEKIKGIKIVFLKNPYKLIKKASLFIAPLRIGSGISNKVLQAMALSKTVVATPLVERGIIGAKNGENIVILKEDPEKWAKKIIWLLENKKIREKIGKKAKELILKNYQLKVWQRKIFKILEDESRFS